MANAIPTRSRDLVRKRDGGRCVRCRMPATNLHHRRRRRVDWDGLAHSPANLITLCGAGNVDGCHGWAHQNPTKARLVGMVLRPDESPLEVPITHVQLGVVTMTDAGAFALAVG